MARRALTAEAAPRARVVRAGRPLQLFFAASKRTTYRITREPGFPKPVRLTSGGVRGYLVADLERWLESRKVSP